MGWDDWLHSRKKTERRSLHSSEDFRKDKKKNLLASLAEGFSSACAKFWPFGSKTDGRGPAPPLKPEPQLPPLTDRIGIPYIGAVKAYYLLLVGLFLLFLATKITLVGLGAGALMVFIVGWEFYAGIQMGGLRGELEETAVAIGLALLIWFGSGWLLNTPTPINAIVSCSMLPAYDRGDMVILQGGAVNTPYFDYDGPSSDINSSARIRLDGKEFALSGSLMLHCLQENPADPVCRRFVSDPGAFTEIHGPLELTYDYCDRTYPKSGESKTTVCVSHTSFNGQPVPFDEKSELIVYAPKPTDFYGKFVGGEIVHRARLGVKARDGTVFFTKGDNNPIYDFQAYDAASRSANTPIAPEQIKGRVVVRIPFLGNFKLFITPGALISGAAMSGCDSYYIEKR